MSEYKRGDRVMAVKDYLWESDAGQTKVGDLGVIVQMIRATTAVIHWDHHTPPINWYGGGRWGKCYFRVLSPLEELALAAE